MPETHLSFAKIVATPTADAWAQAYNAGSLFAVLSLTGQPPEDQSLSSIGKQIFNNLEAEFFTLEEKNLASIKKAVHAVCEEIPAGITPSFCIAYNKDTIIY